ncbi:unnamed protein product [Sympodiomycopsis kandeliae]
MPTSQLSSGQNGASGSGSGKDFVLFEEPDVSSSLFSSSATPIDLNGTPSQLSRPLFTDKPSFTQYRGSGADGPASSGAPDSPFASPASKLIDDFSGPSSVGSHGSATFSPITGVPNRKRQRANHEKSNSTGLPGSSYPPASALPSGHNHSTPSSPLDLSHRKRNSTDLSSSIPGLADSTGDGWTLADTSPQEPPSGSFGPPIGSLSLGGLGGSGDDNADSQDLFPSLFPGLSSDFNSSRLEQSFSPPQDQPASRRSSADSKSLPSDENSENLEVASIDLSAVPATMQTDPTPHQEAIARRQVQNDLRGVDQRALKGPLRALAQQTPQTPLENRVSQSQVESALKAAVDSFVAEADCNRNRLGSARAPGTGGVTGTSIGSLSQDQRNLLFPGPAEPSEQQTSSMSGNSRSPPDATAPPARPSVGPRKRSNSFDASFLPASRPWFSQSPPQQEQYAQPNGINSNHPNEAPGGSGMGKGTGWTGQPTNAFNAFDLSGMNAAPIQPQRRPLTRDRSGLTVSPKETYLNFSTDDASLMATIAAWQGGLFDTNPSTPIAVENGKPPLWRGKTVRPPPHQQLPQIPDPNKSLGNSHAAPKPSLSQAAPGAKPRTMTAASSASSDLSLISPTSSDTTNEDEDGSPLGAYYARAPEPVDYDALLKQQQQQQQQQHRPVPGVMSSMPWPPNSRTNQSSQRMPTQGFNAPRFLNSASSSSEEEEDSRLPASSSIRGFHGFQIPPMQPSGGPTGQSALESIAPGTSGLSAADSFQHQPLGRGRGLQGGYGYMPGSAESGLQLDGSNVAARPNIPAGAGLNAVDQSSQQSQEEERISPSIRSAAQAISPQGYVSEMGPSQQLSIGGASQTAPSYAAFPLPAAKPPMQASQLTRNQAALQSDASQSSSSEDGLDAAAQSDTDDSDYQANSASGAGNTRRKTKTSKAASARKSSSNRPVNASGTPMYGHSLAHSGSSHHGNLTICEYVSPLSGGRCGTEFHRPYDLARHRETIHAKEEASLIRQGKLTKEQCRVLYVEVDPQRSQATQEWKCDGKNGCGSVFSRKDALQRHRRLRNH